MSISLSHSSLARVWPRLMGFLLLFLALAPAPLATASAVTEEQILEDLQSAAATYESNQNNGVTESDEPDLVFSTHALDSQPINIDGHILIIAGSIAVIAGAGTTLLIIRKKSTV